MQRKLLHIDTAAGSWRLETLQAEELEKDGREEYLFLSGETLCQYLLRRDPAALIIARGPLPFLAGNKATVGYVSPATGLPHYSFVGGRAAAQLLNLGLDAICLHGRLRDPCTARRRISEPGKLVVSAENSDSGARNACSGRPNGALRPANAPIGAEKTALGGENAPSPPYIVVTGRAPDLEVGFKPSEALPSGQRSAFYWLLESELDGERHSGSIFTIGEGARLGYSSANLAVEAIYHAGRGGAGGVFYSFASALVLRGDPIEAHEFFAAADTTFERSPNAAIADLLDVHCARLSGPTGGTIAKLPATGTDSGGRNTLPAYNASRLGYAGARLGASPALRATRDGQTGCHWCQVDCRHYHWVPAEYAPEGKDTFLDDFEPTYAVFAMLGLAPEGDSAQDWIDLRMEVDRRLILPIEQMGCDVIEIGLGLAALFEGVERGIIPLSDAPDFVASARGLRDPAVSAGGRLEAAVEAVELLRSGRAQGYPALLAVAGGPQALALTYPKMQDSVFTGGKGTLGNAGHANALWTFLMPFSRFFGHYVGQLYKIEEELPPSGSAEEDYRRCFERVVRQALEREYYWVLGNALSLCAFTFVIFSQDGEGNRLSDDDLLVRMLRGYSIQTTRRGLEWAAQAFWAQSIDLKCQFGWRPPSAVDLPQRIYEALSQALERPADELRTLMDMLIDEWKHQAGKVLHRYGYEPGW